MSILSIFFLGLGILFSLSLAMLGALSGLLSPLALFSYSIILGVYVRFIFVSSAAYFEGFSSILVSSGGKLESLALADILVFLVFVVIGYSAARGLKAKALSARFASSVDIPKDHVSFIACWILFAGGWIIFLSVLSFEFGSIAQGVELLQRRVQLNSSALIIASIFLTVGLAGLCSMVGKIREKSRLTWLFLVLCGLLHLIFLFMTGGRQLTIVHAITFLVAAFWSPKSRVRLSLRSLFFALVSIPIIIGVMILGLSMRISAQSGQELSESILQISPRIPHLISQTFNTFDLYLGARHYTEVVGYSYGSNFVDILSRFIPRSIWPEKPYTLNLLLRQFYYGDLASGVPPTLIGEFYIALGPIGIAVGGIFYGWLLRCLAYFKVLSLSSPAISATYIYLTLTLTVGTLKTGLEIGVFLCIYFILGMLLVKFLSRVFCFSRVRVH